MSGWSKLKDGWRKCHLSASDYAQNGHLYLVKAGSSEAWGADADHSKLRAWFESKKKPRLFRNGSANDLAGALGAAQALVEARVLKSVLMVYAPIGILDYTSRFRQYNPAVDAVIMAFARLTKEKKKRGSIWTHSFAGPATTIALSNLWAEDVRYLKHQSIAPAYYHANEYKGGLWNTKVETIIYQATGDSVSRSGSYTQNPYSLAHGSVHDGITAAKKNITFHELKGGSHPIADYLTFDELNLRGDD